MTPAERAAVHAMAGAFARLSLAAQLVAQAKPGPARAALVDSMEEARRSAQGEFTAAQDVLAPPASTSSASPAQPPPSIRAAETPVTSPMADDVEHRRPPGAGDGRAVSPAPLGTIAQTALEFAKAGPFYAGQLAARTGKCVETCRTTLWALQKQGLLTYTPPAGGPGRGRSGQYAAAVPVEQLVLPAKPLKRKPSMEPRLARSGEPVADEAAELARYGVRRVPVEQAARVSERAVPGVHLTPAAFFADRPELPANRPPVLPEYGGGRVRA